MSIIYVLLPLALLLGFGFLAAFLLSTGHGQFEDLETPAHRILIEELPVTLTPPQENPHVR